MDLVVLGQAWHFLNFQVSFLIGLENIELAMQLDPVYGGRG